MLTVQYIGKGERTIGTQVAYPGEMLTTTPNMLAAWRAQYGDVFAVPGEAAPEQAPEQAPADEAAPGEAAPEQAPEQAPADEAAPKAPRSKAAK
jgi:hypothetical protein